MIFIVSSARSGSTWLGKTFDAHPNVIYRHEPDRSAGELSIPYFPNREDWDGISAQAAQWVERLGSLTTSSVSGSMPQFRKTYRPIALHWARLALVLGAKGLDRAGWSHARIPDWIAPNHFPVTVIKSVDSVGRIGLIAAIERAFKVVHLVRHPCGYVGSQLRGAELGLLNPNPYVSSMADLPGAQRRGMTLDYLREQPLERQLALAWALKNDHGLEQAQGMDNVRVAVYDQLVRDPDRYVSDLFDWCGLDWAAECAQFLRSSTRSSSDTNRYYGVNRDPIIAANRWREELSSDQQASIIEAVSFSDTWKALQSALLPDEPTPN